MTPQITLNHHSYTVALVCALPKEQTAVRGMLDEDHSDLPKPPNDPNTYTLGSVGDHNVVITCLPKGKMGNNPAATVAAFLVSAFPCIKFILMVGIGGGVPPKVRLGDVVVGTPIAEYPGVVQWDYGKARQGHDFERIGSLDNPPTSVLTALSKLESTHELNGSQIPYHLEELAQKYPLLKQKYLKSPSWKDVLFRANYQHVSEATTNSATISGNNHADEARDSCIHCDDDERVTRDPQGMRVHYGLIASGNQVVKNGILRDNLNEYYRGNLLCVEMEAAGLMNSFPCVVIRGICDYADSHKNKIWQEHAAAVAAAFAKEVLKTVPRTHVDSEPVAKETVTQVALVPNLQALQHALNEVEFMCARLNRELGEKKEMIISIKIELEKTRKRKTVIRSYAGTRALKGKCTQLTRELHRVENEEDLLWIRLNETKADQDRLRDQLNRARGGTSEISNGLASLSLSSTEIQGKASDCIKSKRASSDKPRIYIVRSREHSQVASANGLHRVWR